MTIRSVCFVPAKVNKSILPFIVFRYNNRSRPVLCNFYVLHKISVFCKINKEKNSAHGNIVIILLCLITLAAI